MYNSVVLFENFLRNKYNKKGLGYNEYTYIV